MKTLRYTIDNLHEQFPDDNACLDYIFQQRFGGMVACPKCDVTESRYCSVRSKIVYECKDCGNQISPLANTIFYKSETSLKKWFYAMYMFSVSRNGVSGKELERTLGVTNKTAWRMCKQIRLIMQQSDQPLIGIVDIDETYMSSTRRKIHQRSQWDNKTKGLDKGFVHYTPNLGTLDLRQALSESLMTYKNLTYDPLTEIMVTAGGQEAMYLSLMALLEPGDEVLIPDPGYSQFTTCVRLAQGVPVPYPLLLEQNSAPDLEAAEMLLSDRTRAIIVNSPHNPTGGVMTPQQVDGVCGFAKNSDLLLFSDEAYDRMVFEGNRFVSPASQTGMKEKTAIWGSLSKTYSMTGWRIGDLAAPADVVAGAVKMQQNVLLSVCSFAQAGAVSALQGPQECVETMVTEFERRRRVILDGLSHAPGLSAITDPRGAFYVFVRHDTPGKDSSALADYLLDHGGVAVVPGTTFGENGDGCFRISFAASYEDCKEGMERIAECMKGLAG